MTDFANAYITAAGAYLPGLPVGNEDIEEVLGRVHNKPSRLKKKILKSNGIQTRHYAMDKNQRTTHQNSELAWLATKNCLQGAELDPGNVEMLAVASTQGDLPLPGMASMVQAQLGVGPLEILSTHGVCSSGMMALKAAVNQVRLQEKNNALVVASELASRLLKSTRYEAVTNETPDFEAEFLRWMLSDGAGAFLIQSEPRWRGLSLKIDWIEIQSYASHYDLCMSCGTSNQKLWGHGQERVVGAGHDYSQGVNHAVAAVATLTPPLTQTCSWQDYPTYAEAERDGALLIRQNLKLLEDVVKIGVDGFVKLVDKGKIRTQDIDYFVCHYSSHFFRGRILDLLEQAGCSIPEDKWFTNLYTKGNTGCASIFIALDELYKSGKLQPGQTLLCVVPESGRFTTAYMKLTVVAGRSS